MKAYWVEATLKLCPRWTCLVGFTTGRFFLEERVTETREIVFRLGPSASHGRSGEQKNLMQQSEIQTRLLIHQPVVHCTTTARLRIQIM
jgi:hypothetical protein